VHKNNRKAPQTTSFSIGRLKPLAAFIAGLVVASPALAEQLMLEEIVVTAQKRAENVQDIGATVNSFQGGKLDDYSVQDFADIEQLTPGLSLDSGDVRKKSVSLRGVSQGGESGASSAVDTYWNGVSVSSSQVFGQTYDLDRVEVLRGPQGTLQGKTSPAGALMVITAKPDLEVTEGQLQQSFSDKGSNTQFGLSIPLIPGQLAVRVAGAYTDNDGSDIKNVTTGTDQSARSEGGRLTVVWEPTDTFNAQLTLQYDEQKATAPQALAGSDDSGRGRPTLDAYDRVALASDDNAFSSRNKLHALELNWEVAGHQLTSLSGYKVGWSQDSRDKDLTNAHDEDDIQTVTKIGRTFSQELRLASLESEDWEYILGSYYARTSSSTELDKDSYRFDYNFMTKVFAEDIPTDREEFGLFAHNTFHLSDETRVQLGARWQKMRRFDRYDYVVTLPTLGNAVVADAAAIPDELDSTTSEVVTGGLKLMHDLNEDVMVYASLDSSFRSGGTMIEPRLVGNPNDLIYGDETSKSIELGLKSTFWDGRAQLNGAVYYQLFDGYINQRNDVMVDSELDGVINSEDERSSVVYNGDAIISGAEIDFALLLAESWTLGGGISYNDAVYDDGAEIPCDGQDSDYDGISALATCSADGQRIGGEPNWSVNLTSENVFAVDAGEVYVRALYKFTDSRGNDNLVDGSVPSYGVLNLYTGLRSEDDSWEVSVWAKNLLDTEAEVRRSPYESGYRKVEVLAERSLGLTAKYNFSL